MPSHACADCGAISAAKRCPRCAGDAPANPTSWNGRRDRGAQARFRQQVRAAAGHQCQAIEDGARCRETEGQAHHTEAGNDDPATGVFLCRRHHRLVDPHAR